jgi:hypothetical protein
MVESVVERDEAPSLSSVCGRGRQVVEIWTLNRIRNVRQDLDLNQACVHSDDFGSCLFTWVCFFNDSRWSTLHTFLFASFAWASPYDHRETDRFFAVSGVQLAQSNRDQFHYHRVTFSSILKSKWGSILDKTTVLRITLDIDGVSIVSQTHTHPSHSQTSHLLTSSLSWRVPVPHDTQCMWDMWISQL